MTVATSSNRVDYTGNGSTTVFSFTFRIFADTDLVITTADDQGIETQLVLGDDYTVSGVGSYSGGSITLDSALTNGYSLTIQRVLEITQETDLRNQGAFYAETHEDVFDRMVMVTQQLQEQIDRSAKLPVTNTTDAEELTADIVLLADNISKLTTLYESIGDIQTVADDLNEVTSEIDTVAGSITNVNTVGNNISNVNTVAGVSSNVTTVAGIQANVTTVAGISSAVSGVASISFAVSAVNSNASNINAVNANASNINAVAANNSNITAVASNETNINAVNNNETNIDIVAGISNDVTTVAGINAAVSTVSSNNSNVSTVAGISANVTTVAGISSAVSTVSTNNANVSTVATNIADVSTVAANIVDVQNAEENADAAIAAQVAAEAARDAALAALDSFDDRYLGQKTSDPTLDNDGNALVAGALYFNSVSGIMKLYNGSAWVAAYVSGSAASIAFTPAGGVAAATVQAAIEEVDSEKLAKASNLSDVANAATARGNLSAAALSSAQTFTGGQRGSITALTDGATITPDFAVNNNYSVTLGGNRTLANPTNITAGQSGVIVVTQDGTGSRTLAYGSYFKFAGGTAPTLTTTAAAVDVLAYYCESSTRITTRLIGDVK